MIYLVQSRSAAPSHDPHRLACLKQGFFNYAPCASCGISLFIQMRAVCGRAGSRGKSLKTRWLNQRIAGEHATALSGIDIAVHSVKADLLSRCHGSDARYRSALHVRPSAQEGQEEDHHDGNSDSQPSGNCCRRTHGSGCDRGTRAS